MSLRHKQQHQLHFDRDSGCTLRILDLTISPEDFLIQDNRGFSGSFEVEMCKTCGIVVRAKCTCTFKDGDERPSSMVWNKEGTELKCVICGRDGT